MMLHRFAKQTVGALQRGASRVRCSASVAAVADAEAGRSQPFFDASTIKMTAVDEFTVPEHNNPPVIEPQFHVPGQFVMDPERYTIDCEKYGDAVNEANSELVDEMHSKYADTGLVYLKNTGLDELQAMRKVIGVLITDELKMEYKGGSNWRNWIEPNVYDTGAPKEAWIHYHHEMAYIKASPAMIGFCAKTALPDGRGATFVSEQVQVTEELLATEFGQKLKEKGICYTRCLTDEVHYRDQEQSEFDVYNHWQKSMGTEDPETAEAVATERGLKVEWDLDHPRYGRYMKTKFYCDVYEYCPATDRNVLFASVADHWMWFDTWPGVKLLPNDERPLKITYGDDSEMTADELRQFVAIYDKFGIPLDWRVGDIAIMCNYRWAHGRPIFHLQEGESRELGVVLGGTFERRGQREGKW